MNKIIGTIAVLALVVGGVAYFHKNTTTYINDQGQSLGSVSGPDVSFQTFFHDNINIGGNVLATTSVGAVTYTAASFVRVRSIEHIASGALTATLPTNAALSSAGYLPNIGDTQSLFIHASTTKITLAGNTGVQLTSASSTLQVAAGSIGRLECVRLGVTEGRLIECFLSAD